MRQSSSRANKKALSVSVCETRAKKKNSSFLFLNFFFHLSLFARSVNKKEEEEEDKKG